MFEEHLIHGKAASSDAFTNTEDGYILDVDNSYWEGGVYYPSKNSYLYTRWYYSGVVLNYAVSAPFVPIPIKIV